MAFYFSVPKYICYNGLHVSTYALPCALNILSFVNFCGIQVLTYESLPRKVSKKYIELENWCLIELSSISPYNCNNLVYIYMILITYLAKQPCLFFLIAALHGI